MSCCVLISRFRIALQEATSQHDQMQVRARFSAIYWAHWFHEQVPDHGVPIRWTIEARILARQSDAEIARLNGCSAEVIEAYEALFFNVRERLDDRDFILTSVIGPIEAGSKFYDEGQLWKLCGYLGGPQMLDAMIVGFPTATWPERPEDVVGFLQKLAVGSLQQKAAIAALLPSEKDRTPRRPRKPRVKRTQPKATEDFAVTAAEHVRKDLQIAIDAPTVSATNR
jgi:hypothetical protein